MSISPPTSQRLFWVDHLRTLVILLVVNMHACVTYSHVGDWYAMSPHEPSLTVKLPFIPYQTLTPNPFGLATLLTITGLVASYIVADLARRVPGLRTIL